MLNGAGARTAVATLGILGLIGMTPVPAHAQVLEVRPDGSVAAYAGPVQTVDGVASPIPGPTLASGARHGRPIGHDRGARLAPAADLPRLVQDASDRSQLSAKLLDAVAWQESRMNQSEVSPKGARGIMQLMPTTAARLGVDAADARGNLQGGAAYLSSLLREFDGDIILSLAAYNAGPEAVRRWGGVPPYPETRAYVAAVLDRLSQLAREPRPMTR